MHLTLRNDPDEIGRLPGLLESFSEGHDLPPAVIARLNLILEELATNVMHYGFRGGEEDRIEIDLQRQPSSILFRFRDNGAPYNPLEAPAAAVDAPLEDRVPGGLGLHLVREIADAITYRFADGWNELDLRLDYLAE